MIWRQNAMIWRCAFFLHAFFWFCVVINPIKYDNYVISSSAFLNVIFFIKLFYQRQCSILIIITSIIIIIVILSLAFFHVIFFK